MALLAVFLFGFSALLVALGEGVRPSDRSDPDFYVATVTTMIDEGMFEVRADANGSRIVPRDAHAAAAVANVDGLQADMANVNLWTVEGGTVKAFIGKHGSARPFDVGGTWRGSLRYARPLRIAADIVLSPDDAASPPLVLSGADPASGDDAVLPLRASPQPISGPAIRIACARAGADFVRLYLVGRQPVVDAHQGNACRTEVAARRLVANCAVGGVAPDTCQFAPLEPGQTLKISRSDGRVLGYHWRELPTATGILDRTLDGGTIVSPDLQPFAVLVRDDLEIGLHGCQGSRFKIHCNDDLILSFDQEIQRDVTAALAAHFRKEQPHLAAVAVMNAKTGEVLALGANAPEQQAPDAPECPYSALCLLPIGSAAKPMFAASVLSANPALAGFRIAVTPMVTRAILGLPVGELKNHGAQDVDFTDFIRRSDNYYGASLMLLASPAPDGACSTPRASENHFWVGAREFDGVRPRSAFEAPPAISSARCNNRRPIAFRPDWALQLQRLFDINPWASNALFRKSRSTRYYGDDFHDGLPWAALYLSGSDHRAMPRSSPRRASFDIQAIKDFRGELVPLLLGNGNGRWTIVKLAEAYSRIVTGTEVRSTFTARPQSAGFATLAGFSAAQRVVTSGMAEVLQQRGGKLGTASRSAVPTAVRQLQQQLPPGYVLGAFAKTGTMEVPPASFGSCPRRLKHDQCFGNSFIIVLALYERNAAGLEMDPASGLVRHAILGPRCAITVAVNLPAWHPDGSSATSLAATLIHGGVGKRLMEPICAPRT